MKIYTITKYVHKNGSKVKAGAYSSPNLNDAVDFMSKGKGNECYEIECQYVDGIVFMRKAA